MTDEVIDPEEAELCQNCGHEAFWHIKLDRPSDCLAASCDCEQFEGDEDA